MYLVMGITGKVGGATARHLLKQGKQVRALVRTREKAAKWTDQGVELVDGDWNDATAIAAALKDVEGAFVMVPAVWAPSPDYREAKGVIANYVEALTKVVPPRVVALSSMGANRTSGVGMITALSLLEQGFSKPAISDRICARRRLLRKLSLWLTCRPPATSPGQKHGPRRGQADPAGFNRCFSRFSSSRSTKSSGRSIEQQRESLSLASISDH